MIANVLDRFQLSLQGSVLEIGPASGGNRSLFGDFESYLGMECNELAVRLAPADLRRNKELIHGCWPEDRSLLGGRKFDLVALLDVVEHLDDPASALRHTGEILSPGGKVLITVPAYQWMWSVHDLEMHHKRRYTGRSLRGLLDRTGFEVEFSTYFNSLLFLPAVVARKLGTLLSVKANPGYGIPPRPVNKVLSNVLGAEAEFLKFARLPFGLSILAVAHAKGANGVG